MYQRFAARLFAWDGAEAAPSLLGAPGAAFYDGRGKLPRLTWVKWGKYTGSRVFETIDLKYVHASVLLTCESRVTN